ncbi:MAG: DUF2330 domain-containing protein [Gemmataceae bacterium]
MRSRWWVVLGGLLVSGTVSGVAWACCAAPPSGKPVVNADQTVIIIWDAANQMQHFIRKATFASSADDFGFLVPTPEQPELAESGNDAFPYVQSLTEPERVRRTRPVNMSCGCSKMAAPDAAMRGDVQVLEQKLVAGFDASVLAASSSEALVQWLEKNGYAYSPAVQAWAQPYVDAGWKFTALKVAKAAEGKQDEKVAASALRISFKTDRPLFPYREPESASAAKELGINHRLLRIYFVGEARYQGELTREQPWTGKVAWADKLTADQRKRTLELLGLPETTGPAEWWLTEFEDPWPYEKAPADVYFARSADQGEVKRPPIVEYVAAPYPTDVMMFAIAGFLFVPPVVRLLRRKPRQG